MAGFASVVESPSEREGHEHSMLRVDRLRDRQLIRVVESQPSEIESSTEHRQQARASLTRSDDLAVHQAGRHCALCIAVDSERRVALVIIVERTAQVRRELDRAERKRVASGQLRDAANEPRRNDISTVRLNAAGEQPQAQPYREVLQ